VEALTLGFIATACSGKLVNGSPEKAVLRVCTDSRQIQAGDLFFALKGEKFDGHDFLGEVSKKAAAVVVEPSRVPAAPGHCAVLAVESPRQALGLLARAYRRDFALPVIAIAGSNGKTGTKELVAAVLQQRLSTIWSEASFNNDIGVPMTLLRLESSHQVAVLEAGTNHPGELEPLVRMIRPDYGVITSIGREHLEFFGDLEGVAAEEGRLAELLPASGKLILNGDDPWSARLAERTRASVIKVGTADRNDWRLRNLRLDSKGATFAVDAPKAEHSGEYRIFLLGRHQAVNALFAIALGAELQLSQAEIQRGLEVCKAPKMRLQLWEWNGVRVLDDAYNANADSMVAALQTLQDLPCKGRRVALLGDMAELGTHSDAAHEEVGRRAAELGIAQLFVVGKMAPVLARGARGAGMSRVLEFADVEAAAAAVKQFIKAGDVLLLKASRATHLERVTEILRSGNSVQRN
jgi:UDP-N-acetylmuramoyl-tripeptide--D-alanyl-D-alanine ligase